jgi:hypothetical protein
MKFLWLGAGVLTVIGCRTADYTRGEPNVCELHGVGMSRERVPIAYGMIPMSRMEAERGEWKRRQTVYPHPGDCLPASDIKMTGDDWALVYVCSQCREAQKAIGRTAQ